MLVVKHTRRKFIRNSGLLFAGLFGPSAVSIKYENKKVTLLGDSIRKGYQPYVSLFLPDTVAVWGPEENTQHSVHLLANSPRWIKDQPADIIHLNSGLHDIKNIPFHSRKPLVSAELYAENIERIIKYIHYCLPECIIIWSTTTPVDDERALAAHESDQDFSRYNEDVVKYNDISKEIVQRLGIPVNDLYAFVMKADKNLIMKNDGVHFTDFGNELLGEQVADSIGLFIK
jgi:lysophospholipase L1-like esterase